MYNNGNSSKNVTGSSVVDGTLENADYADNGLSGDKIDGGIISNFQSTGIDDRLPTGKVITLSDTGVAVAGTVTANSPVEINSSSSYGLRVFGVDQAYSRIRVDNLNGQAWDLIAGAAGASNSGFGIYDADAGSTRLQIDSSGKTYFSGGIYLNGETAAANALDDYEEGTWTPTITIRRGWSTVTAWTVNYATYTKIGDIVHLEASITPNGGSSDDVVLGDQIDIDGEPFYPTNGNSGSKPRGDCYAKSVFVNGGITTGQVQFYGGYMYLQITSVGSSTTWNAHQDDPVTFSITYRKS
jgi:hypothetical protein